MDTRPRRYRSIVTFLLLLIAALAATTNSRVAGLLPRSPATVFAQGGVEVIEPIEREMISVRERLLERLRANGTTHERLKAAEDRFRVREAAVPLRVASRRYLIEGFRSDGRVDRTSLTARTLRQTFGNDYLSALPQGKEHYQRISVHWLADNSDNATADLAAQYDSIVSNKPNVLAETPIPPVSFDGLVHNTSPLAAQIRLMNVTKVREGTVVDILTPGTNGGTNRWFLTEEEKSGTDEIAKWVEQSGSVVHAGDELPADWMDSLFPSRKSRYLRRSLRSANLFSDLLGAAALGSTPLDASRLTFFNALPQETGLWASPRELWRMDLHWLDTMRWQEANDKVREAAASVGVRAVVAKKPDVLHELHQGSHDVLFIVAHGSGESIILPGGDFISTSDLEQIRRGVAPYRMAIVISCRAGEVNGGAPASARRFSSTSWRELFSLRRKMWMRAMFRRSSKNCSSPDARFRK